MEFVRHPVSAMDRHENLGVYEITPVVEGVDYVAVRKEMEQLSQEIQQEQPHTTEIETGVPNFQSADVALAMLEKFKLPDYSDNFVEHDDDEIRPVNE
jgi:hypothetical protein